MHLNSHKAVEKFKKCDFFFVGRKTEKPMFLGVRKSFVKTKLNCKTFDKCYSSRFIDIVRLMNDSLDSIIDNLTLHLYNTKYKHCMKCVNCKKCKKSKDDGIE